MVERTQFGYKLYKRSDIDKIMPDVFDHIIEWFFDGNGEDRRVHWTQILSPTTSRDDFTLESAIKFMGDEIVKIIECELMVEPTVRVPFGESLSYDIQRDTDVFHDRCQPVLVDSIVSYWA